MYKTAAHPELAGAIPRPREPAWLGHAATHHTGTEQGVLRRGSVTLPVPQSNQAVARRGRASEYLTRTGLPSLSSPRGERISLSFFADGHSSPGGRARCAIEDQNAPDVRPSRSDVHKIEERRP